MAPRISCAGIYRENRRVMPVKRRKKCRVLACVWLTCIKYRPDGDLGQAGVRLHTGNGVHYRLPHARKTSRRLHLAGSGGLVSIDAMGSQSAIAEAIVEAGADYQTWPLSGTSPSIWCAPNQPNDPSKANESLPAGTPEPCKPSSDYQRVNLDSLPWKESRVRACCRVLPEVRFRH